MYKSYGVWMAELEYIARKLLIELEPYKYQYHGYYAYGWSPERVLKEIEQAKSQRTILIHDAQYSVLDGHRPVIEVFDEEHLATAYECTDTIQEAKYSRVRTNTIRRCINGVETKIVMACDPKIQELIGLQCGVFDQQEKLISDLRLSLKTQEELNSALMISKGEIQVQLDKLENMTTWQCFTRWFNKLITF